jgi:hypothetical protein
MRLPIISHGTDGSIDIGAMRLDADALNENATAIAAWGDAFDDSGDLLIFGCDLASTGQGQNFVDSLTNLTGTDVAASVDLTGHAVLGRDWNLEYKQGDIESAVAPSAEVQQSWVGILEHPGTDAPSVNTPGTPTFVEGGPAVVLDSDVEAFDVELSAIDNFVGTTLTLIRNGGAHGDDQYTAAVGRYVGFPHARWEPGSWCSHDWHCDDEYVRCFVAELYR